MEEPNNTITIDLKRHEELLTYEKAILGNKSILIDSYDDLINATIYTGKLLNISEENAILKQDSDAKSKKILILNDEITKLRNQLNDAPKQQIVEQKKWYQKIFKK